MKELKALIVDDEEAARNVLRRLLERNCPDLQIVGTANDVPTAVELIRKEQPHVVFLDVQMPQYAGYEIIDFFDTIDFEIIFVTAYDQYAIKAFELSAVDYLIKPISRNRLVESIEKLQQRVHEKNAAQKFQLLKDSLQQKSLDQIVISELGNQRILRISDIIAIQANGAYSEIFLVDGQKVLASKNLKQFESMLTEGAPFFRSHKSWLINFHHIQNYTKSDLEIHLSEEIKAKLSKYKKAEFESSFSTK
ncbi:MAG: LytTR family DNA-binding domain-containing protein [Crocinitomicaceae bacterium]